MSGKSLMRVLSGMAAVLTLSLCGCAVPQEGVVSPVREATKRDPVADSGKVDLAEPEGNLWNLKDFGAVGDGSTDASSALKTAIADVLAAGGGTLYIPDGTYRLTETITLSGDDDVPLTLCADPTGSAVFISDADTNGPALVVERSGVTLFGLDFQHRTSEEQPVIVVTGSHNVLDSVTARMTGRNSQPGFLVYGSYNTLKNCGVGYTGMTQYMMIFSKMPGTESVGNILEDCHFGGQAAKCVLVTSEDENGAPEQMIIRRNVFLVVACDQVEVRAARDLYITDNMLDAAGVCVLMDPIAVGIKGVQITDNYCGASTGGDRTGGLRTENRYGGTIEKVVISANYFWAPNAVRVTEPVYTNFKMTDNYFVLTGGEAVYMDTAIGAFLEGNVVTNVSGGCPLRIGNVDDVTVIQNNNFGDGVDVPDWQNRFRKQNTI